MAPSDNEEIKDEEWYTIKVKGQTKKRLLLAKASYIITSGGNADPSMDDVINGTLNLLPKGEIKAVIEVKEENRT